MLAKTVHPDKQDAQIEKANVVFREVEQAYSILSNPITRAIYDCYGQEGLDLYDNYKSFFEDLPKESEDIRKKTLSRYRAVKIMNENTKAIEQIDKQSLKVSCNMMYYFVLNFKRWIHPKPFMRFSGLNYHASMKYGKDKLISINVDGIEDRKSVV